jgi:hypothetical protein
MIPPPDSARLFRPCRNPRLRRISRRPGAMRSSPTTSPNRQRSGQRRLGSATGLLEDSPSTSRRMESRSHERHERAVPRGPRTRRCRRRPCFGASTGMPLVRLRPRSRLLQLGVVLWTLPERASERRGAWKGHRRSQTRLSPCAKQSTMPSFAVPERYQCWPHDRKTDATPSTARNAAIPVSPTHSLTTTTLRQCCLCTLRA